MDVEATEHHVLAGMTRLLETCRPVIVSEVLYNRNEQQQQAILERHGYRWYWITDRGLVQRDEIVGDQTYQCRNYLYVHPESRLAPNVLDIRKSETPEKLSPEPRGSARVPRGSDSATSARDPRPSLLGRT